MTHWKVLGGENWAEFYYRNQFVTMLNSFFYVKCVDATTVHTLLKSKLSALRPYSANKNLVVVVKRALRSANSLIKC